MKPQITIELNGEIRKIEKVSLSELLNILNITDKSGLAIAINYEVVPKNFWNDYQISDQDKIILITATQGG